ncbi:MAG: transporter substrate-binding domain-containing protein [Myxococcota bacterium]
MKTDPIVSPPVAPTTKLDVERGVYLPTDERLLGMPELRVRVEDGNYAPFQFTNEQGLREGFSVGVMNELARRLGRTPVYYPGDFSGAFADVASGEFDIASVDATYTLARELLGLLFTGRPYVTEQDTLIVAKTAAATSIEDVLRSSDYSIAVQEGAATVPLLTNSHQVPSERLVQTPTSDDAVRKMADAADAGQNWAVVTKLSVVEAVLGAERASGFKALSGDIYDVIGGNRGPSFQIASKDSELYSRLQLELIAAARDGAFASYGERYGVQTLSAGETARVPTTRQADLDAR